MRERRRLLDQRLAGAAVVVACVTGVLTAGQVRDAWKGVLDEHPAIQYATRPTTDRVAKLGQALAGHTRSLQRDTRVGYLRSLLEALDLSPDSQLLVFSKTGVQSAYTSPRNPRALFFDESVVVGYVPGAPVIEMAAHDPQQGVVFYTVDQNAAAARPVRRTSCLSCHVSASTLLRAGDHRAQQHRRRRRIRVDAARHPGSDARNAASGSMGRMVRHDGKGVNPLRAARARGEHHVLGTRQHIQSGVRGLARQRAGNARLSLVLVGHRHACWSSITRCTR